MFNLEEFKCKILRNIFDVVKVHVQRFKVIVDIACSWTFYFFILIWIFIESLVFPSRLNYIA